jgi:lactoylglutathione lyase
MNILKVDHIGIRVADAKRAVDFYRRLGFEVILEVDFDAVIIMKNAHGVELNLITNGVDLLEGKNILMDLPEKHAGYTHVALRVESILQGLTELRRHGIAISQGPVTFGGNDVSVFIRDPDRNVIELRGHEQDLSKIPGLTQYQP